MKKIILVILGFLSILLASDSFAGRRSIALVNRSSQAIISFYASNTRDPVWEEDILGRDILYSNEFVRINLDDGSGSCEFDFKVVTSNLNVIYRNDVNVCDLLTYTLTD